MVNKTSVLFDSDDSDSFSSTVDTNGRQQLPHSRSVRLWSSSCAAGVSVAHRRYSTQQTESAEEETLHTIISDTENVQGKPEFGLREIFLFIFLVRNERFYSATMHSYDPKHLNGKDSET